MSGVISDNTGRSSGLVKAASGGASALLATSAVSGATSATFDGYFSTTYNRYEVVCSDLLMAGTSSDLWFRVRVGGSTDAQSLYVNTNAWQYTDVTPSHQIAIQSSSSNETDSPSNYWKSNGDNLGIESRHFMHYTIYDPLNTDSWKMMLFRVGYTAGTVMQMPFGHGMWKADTALTGMEIWSSSDNMQGTFNLYGYKTG